MPINENHQLSIITDILENQKTDCCGTVSECQQLQRLVKSLLANKHIDSNIKNTLFDIYDYSQTGVNIQDLTQHIEQNKHYLSQWIDTLYLKNNIY